MTAATNPVFGVRPVPSRLRVMVVRSGLYFWSRALVVLGWPVVVHFLFHRWWLTTIFGVLAFFQVVGWWRREVAMFHLLRFSPVVSALNELDHEEYVGVVGRFLTEHGCRLQPADLGGDDGLGLLGTGPEGESMVVSCLRKRPGDKVMTPQLARFLAVRERHGATHGVLVSTCRFSDEVAIIAGSRGVTVIDGLMLGGSGIEVPGPTAAPPPAG